MNLGRLLLAGAACAMIGSACAQDYTVNAHFIDASIPPNIVGKPTTPDTNFYVGFQVNRGTGTQNIAGFAFDIHFDSSQCDFNTQRTDISDGGGMGVSGLGNMTAEDAIHTDDQAQTNVYRLCTASWDFTAPVMPVPMTSDWMLRVRFRTSATYSGGLIMTVVPAPDSSQPLQQVTVNTPYVLSSANFNLVDDAVVPVTVSGFAIE